MTTTELETLYRRLDDMRMTPAERELAKARLAQADALAGFFLALGAGVARLMRAGTGPARRSSDLSARASS